MVDFHERLVERAQAMGARGVRVLHRGRRPRLTGMVDGVPFILRIPLRPRDIPETYFNAVRDLRRVIARIRARNTTTAA